MEGRINVAEILKDCPKGMELDCPIFGEVYLKKIRPHLAIVVTTDKEQGDFKEEFLYDGRYGMNGECILFPSKDKTWEGFKPPCKIKDGDVLFVDCSDGLEENKDDKYIFILNKPNYYGEWHSYCHLNGVGDFDPNHYFLTDDKYQPRFATKEEQLKLFNAIKENGYRWNEETKTLEKLVIPKFKIGDIIQDIDSYKVTITNVYVEDEEYGYESFITKGIGSIRFDKQDEWELVPNKFDISTLKPFDKVLARYSKDGIWGATFFSHCNKELKWGCYKFVTTSSKSYPQVIPFEGNEHLLGTSNDCDEYFKTWE